MQTFIKIGAVVFSGRQLRSVVCLSVCHLSSVTLVHPTQSVAIFGNFLHHTIAQGLSFSDAKNRWWERPFASKICAESDPPPFRAQQFRTKSAHSASTVIASDTRTHQEMR